MKEESQGKQKMVDCERSQTKGWRFWYIRPETQRIRERTQIEKEWSHT